MCDRVTEVGIRSKEAEHSASQKLSVVKKLGVRRIASSPNTAKEQQCLMNSKAAVVKLRMRGALASPRAFM